MLNRITHSSLGKLGRLVHTVVTALTLWSRRSYWVIILRHGRHGAHTGRPVQARRCRYRRRSGLARVCLSLPPTKRIAVATAGARSMNSGASARVGADAGPSPVCGGPRGFPAGIGVKTIQMQVRYEYEHRQAGRSPRAASAPSADHRMPALGPNQQGPASPCWGNTNKLVTQTNCVKRSVH